MNLHEKIQKLKLTAEPFTRSAMRIDSKGVLVDDLTVEGYCCVWGVKDDRGTGWIRGAFAKSINDRGPKSNAKSKILSVWQHQISNPIGQVIELEEDDYGLRFKIIFDDIPEGRRAAIQVKSGTINQFSFGFDYVWDQMYYDEKTDTIWVKEAELFEISPVTFASMEDTYAIRSAEDFSTQKNLLDEETDILLTGLPRQKQLEIRQLISRHISLVRNEPLELRQKALEVPEPIKPEKTLDLSLIINHQTKS